MSYEINNAEQDGLLAAVGGCSGWDCAVTCAFGCGLGCGLSAGIGTAASWVETAVPAAISYMC